MSALAVVRTPGVLRTLGLSLAARLPLGVIGLLLLLRARDLRLSYLVGGIATAAFTFGMAAGSPLLGRLVDRRGQPLVLAACGAVAGAALLALGSAPARVPAVLVALSAIVGLAQPPVTACVRAIWSRLLSRDDQETVLALDISLQQVAFLLGPVVLLALAASAGPALALQLTGAVLIVATGAFALAPEARRTPSDAAAAHPALLGALAHGGVLTLVALSVGLGTAFGISEIGIVAFAERHGIEHAIAALYGASAIGALAGGLLWAQRPARGERIRMLQRMLLALAAVEALLALPADGWWLGVVLLLDGLIAAPLLAVLYAMLADVAPPRLLTEAFAWETAGFMSGLALGSALSGALLAVASTSVLFLCAGGMGLATSGVLAARAAASGDISE